MSTQPAEREIVLLESFLKKKSPKTFLGRPIWQERYFVLTPTQLCYYKRKDDVHNEEKCLGYIPITAVLGALKVSTCSKNLQFDVVLEGSSRLFQLEAPVPDSRDQWISRINSALEKQGRKALTVIPMATPGHTKEKFWKPQNYRNLTKRRQAITDDHAFRKVDEEEIKNRDYTKTDEQVQSLLATLRDRVSTFQFLDYDSLIKLINLMWKVEFKAGDIVVEQNTLSSNFYVIASGSFLSSQVPVGTGAGQPIYEESPTSPSSDGESTPTSGSRFPNLMNKPAQPSSGGVGLGSPGMGVQSFDGSRSSQTSNGPGGDFYGNRLKSSLSINPSLEHSSSSGQFSSFMLPPGTSRNMVFPESPLLTSTSQGSGAFFVSNRTANRIGILQPWEHFGELAFVFKSEATHTIRCREAATAFTLDYATYYDFIVEIRKNLLFNRTQILRGLPMFTNMPGEHVSAVSDVLEIRRFKSGDVIIKEGDTSDGFYILRAGAAKMLRHGQLKYIFQDKSDYFGHYSLVTQNPSQCTFIASSEAEFLHIPAPDFAALLPVMSAFYQLVENQKSIDDLPSFNDAEHYHASSHDKSMNYLYITPYTRPPSAAAGKKTPAAQTRPLQQDMGQLPSSQSTAISSPAMGDGKVVAHHDDDIPPPPPPADDDGSEDLPPPPPPDDDGLMFNDNYATADGDDDEDDDDDSDIGSFDGIPFRKATIRFIDEDEMINHRLPADLPSLDTLPETEPPVGLPTLTSMSMEHCLDTEPASELTRNNVVVDHEEIVPDMDISAFPSSASIPHTTPPPPPPADDLNDIPTVTTLESSQPKSAIASANERKLQQYGNGFNHVCTVTDLSQLSILGTLGRGTFGHVQLVSDQHGHTYALKAVSKAHVVRHNQTTHILNERNIMLQLNHPFIVKLYRTLKDRDFLYFILEPSLGGELFTLLRNHNNFDDPTSRFYAAIVVSVFEYLHSKDILYRDLKPENLLMDADGYVRVTDFGFAKRTKERTYTFCGTPDYLAPEIVSSSGHHTGADWWCLGILIYEMLCGYTPFYDENGPTQMYSKILAGKVYFPPTISRAARHLIGSLLQTKPTRRLGVLVGGASAIKNHEWFDGLDWDKLYNRELPSPIAMNIKDKYDLSNFDAYPEDEMDPTEEFIPDPDNPWDDVF